MGRPATDLLPTDFLARHGGTLVAGGRAECWTGSALPKRNAALKSSDGWFGDRQLFFAEAAPRRDDVPDYFYLDADDEAPRPVRYFHLSPTDTGVCAASLAAFVAGTWNLQSSRGDRGPTDE